MNGWTLEQLYQLPESYYLTLIELYQEMNPKQTPAE